MTSEWQRPVTDAQLGIWLGQQMDIASPRYNAAEYISLRGPLDVSRFEQALNDVVRQSITLQLVFKQTEEGPQQAFNKNSSLINIANLEQLDFSQHALNDSNSSNMAAAQAWMQQDLAMPVDLQQGPLFKQALLKLGEDHHLWYQRIHHIACDGFAFALLTQQVSERYSELITQVANNSALDSIENSSVTPASDIEQQLKRFDLIAAENIAYQQSKAWEKDRAYWLDNIRPADSDSSTTIASFSTSTAALANTSLRKSSYITSEQLTRLQQLAAPLGVTWSDLLLACVAQLLYRQTATSEITLGIPVMNRMGSASLRIPAMVMNIIPLSIKLQGAKTFTQLAQAVSQQLKKSRPHLRYRYEQLKHDLGISNGQKLFGPVVNIMPFDRPLGFSSLQAQAHNLSAGPVEDISFCFVLEKRVLEKSVLEKSVLEKSIFEKIAPEKNTVTSNCLRLDLDANPNRYNEAQLDYLQQEFHTQLERILQDINSPLTVDTQAISWLEGKALATPQYSVMHNIYQQLCAKPEAIALQQDDQLFTYQQLAAHSANMAACIADTGVSPHSVIALVLPRSEHAISLALACWLLDCTFVFLDPEAPQERNTLIIANAQPALVITEHTFFPASSSNNQTRLADISTQQISLHYLQQPDKQLLPEKIQQLWQKATQRNLSDISNPAYLIYTSGSTGTPKGVIISHRALAEFVASNQDSYNIQAQDRVLQFAPLHFDACIEEIFVTLSQGARLVLRNSAMLESMPIFLQQCARWKISLLDLPTAFWHELAFACKHLSLPLPNSLRAIIIGGEAVIAERVEQWRTCFGDKVALFNTYGPSEATVIATCVNLCSAEHVVQHLPITIGSPLSGRAIAVVDSNLQMLPKGEEGELLLAGLPSSINEDTLSGGLAEGYLYLPEKTAQAFIQLELPWLEKSLRAYRTGDRVKINVHNQIEFIGRLDDQIKISGYRIDPLEIEEALIKLEAVREAAVVAVTNEQKDKMLVAHLVSDFSASNSAAENIKQLRSQLKHLLPAPMLPSAVVYHQQLPKNSSGKINRKELQQQSTALNNTELNHADSPTMLELSARQKTILSVWQEVLGQKNIQLDDDFFTLGGQSLQCIQVANRLSAKLQREIPVAWLFQHPSINALDKLLDEPVSTENFAIQQNSDPLQSPSHQQMVKDCAEFARKLPAAKQKLHKLATANPCILLTGATGFVGVQLLAQLTKTGNKIICLVRAADEASARSRLIQAFNIQALNANSSELAENIHIQLADLEQPRLGLAEEVFLQLANAVDVIIHNAANTSVMRDYQSLRAANALCTGELLQLAAIQQIPFHLISTVALADYDPNSNRQQLPEDFVPQHSYLRDGYQQSKWVSEHMAAIARDKGYDINVYRLARVTGDLNSAYVNQKDLVWSILQAGLPLGLLPELHFEEPWTPVDKLAQFIVQHSLHNANAGVFNLAPAKNLAVAQLYDWLVHAGQAFSVIPLAQWCTEVKKLGQPQHQPIAEFFLQMLQTKQASDQQNLVKDNSSKGNSLKDNSLKDNQDSPAGEQGLPLTPYIHHQKFDRAAAALNLQLPVIDQALFNRYFAYASARDWFLPATQKLQQTPADEQQTHAIPEEQVL